MNIDSISTFLTVHGNEILLMLLCVLLIRGIRLMLYRRKRNKEIRKEKEQAEKLMRDEALNDEILNPDRKPGDVSEQKHPYKVEYSEQTSEGRDARRKAFQGRNQAGDASLFSMNKKSSTAFTRLRVTECSNLSRRTYMFKTDETLNVGNQYGKTGILAGDSDDSVLYFTIYSRNDAFYIKASGAARIVVSRGGYRKELGSNEIRLHDDDRVAVNDKVYEILFF